MRKSKLLFFGMSLFAIIFNNMTLAVAEDKSNQNPAPAAQTPLPDPIAVVNGKPISRDFYEAYAQQRQTQLGNIETPAARQTLTNELIIQELLFQEAKKQKLTEDPQLAQQLAMLEHSLLANATIRKLLTEQAPSEAEIQQEYKTAAATMANQEYKARHILLASKDKAESIIQALNQGADFANLAKEHSKDSSATNGGEIGWVTADIMEPAFGKAVSQLKKGEYTTQPVQTRFGWHIIVLDDVRKITPPSLTELRPQLLQKLQANMVNDYITQLQENAEIEVR
jgi:peptidyl-prolyl cis-trans isomerase C